MIAKVRRRKISSVRLVIYRIGSGYFWQVIARRVNEI
jgi:hypothetical protein